jgi:hypothetical protein
MISTTTRTTRMEAWRDTTQHFTSPKRILLHLETNIYHYMDNGKPLFSFFFFVFFFFLHLFNVQIKWNLTLPSASCLNIQPM